jgi:DNA-binding NtrC family response regulator
MSKQPKRQCVLVVDRETDFLAWAKNQIEASGVDVLTASSTEEAYRIFCEKEPDLVFTEMNLSPDTGQELLLRVRKHSPNAMVIVTSAFGTTQAVIETMKMGAFDFVRKEHLPFNLKIVIESALKANAELREASAPKPQLTVEQHQDEIVGQSDAMQQVFKMVGRVAASEAPVMITGESGSGKELVARAIHHYSQRSHKTFLAINCAAIPENLLESELFGHEKGSFTGAHNQRVGRFEQCDGGTLFLDEIGEMPLPVQSKLLRVLQEGEFSRVGGNQTLRTDVRIVAATNKILEEEVTLKNFREDLFYRLNVVRIHLPPLRQRIEDIKLLAEYFLQRIANRKLRPLLQLSEEAIKVLESYPWPGNVRELENTMERASVLATTDVLLPKDIPLGSQTENVRPLENGKRDSLSEEKLLQELCRRHAGKGNILSGIESALIKCVLQMHEGNEAAAAKALGITRASLIKRLATK